MDSEPGLKLTGGASALLEVDECTMEAGSVPVLQCGKNENKITGGVFLLKLFLEVFKTGKKKDACSTALHWILCVKC